MELRETTTMQGTVRWIFICTTGNPEKSVMGAASSTRFARAISGPKKVSIFRAHPFQCPS